MQRPSTANRAQQIEQEVFHRFFRNQANIVRQLDDQEALRQRERERKEEIRLKSKGEVIKHPNNGHLWMHLAGFIDGDSQPDLDAIETRQREREARRQEIARQHQQQSSHASTDPSHQQQNNPKTSNKHPQKIPWKLMRELRRQQVEQNRTRLEKMRTNQAQKMHHYHKY